MSSRKLQAFSDSTLADSITAALRVRLLAWYDANARDLPWRQPPRSAMPSSPYPVWLSEIMLQQTRVAAVIAHYHEFLRRFPTVEKLARAREASVLAAWSGLGYYRRARMLHARGEGCGAGAGREISRDGGGIAGLAGRGTLHCRGDCQHCVRRAGSPWWMATSSGCCSACLVSGWPGTSCGERLRDSWITSGRGISIRR